MINRLKIKDARRLMNSKIYVLITEDETTLHGELGEGLTKVMQLSALKTIRKQVDRLIKETTAKKPSK